MSKYYSQEVPKILDKKDRVRIGRQIIGVLKAHLGKTDKLNCLDIGCSRGVITNRLADCFDRVIGIDVDKRALRMAKRDFKRKNLDFIYMNASDLKFRNGSFDVVIANQLYEFVEDDKRVFEEIRRVLKPGGACFFGARNKYAIMEAQYSLPFLSWLPKKISDLIVKSRGSSSEFIGRYRSYWGLRQLVKDFRVHDYTLEILKNPERFNFTKLNKYRFIFRLLPMSIVYPFIPNYIWILEKR